MAKSFVEGIKRLNRVLEQMSFESNNQKNIIRRVARKGGNVLKDETKRQIPARENFEHVAYIRRSVKVQTSKSRYRPGVNVIIKGGDVPVGQGKSRRFWKLRPYADLALYGNYKTRNRPDKRGKKHGNVRGITGYNPFEIARLNKGNRALIVMSKSLIPEIQKEFKKLKARG